MDKEYPDNYPSDAVRILSEMAFGKDIMLLGSASIRSALYAGDYDAHEEVRLHYKTNEEALRHLKDKFQSIVKRLGEMPNVFVGDIKAGLKEEWRVVPEDFKKYKPAEALEKLKAMKDILTTAEYNEAKQWVRGNSRLDWLKAKDNVKFHIVRWTPEQVRANRNVLRDGSVMTLEEAFSCPTIAKLDTIGLVGNNRFTDFSIIYAFFNNGKALNPTKEDVGQALKDNIVILKSEGNYFKMLKRQFSAAKLHNDIPTIAKLIPILNSDLGRLYHIVGDIGTLIDLLDSEKKVPMDRVRFQIDQMIGRLSNIYEMRDYLKAEPAILKDIRRVLELPESRLGLALEGLRGKLDAFLQKGAKNYVG